mgnify:CR=1 FL=1
MKKLLVWIFLFANFTLKAQKVIVDLDIEQLTKDTLILSITYTNNTNKTFSIIGFTSLNFENYFPIRESLFTPTEQNIEKKYYNGYENDTINLFLPITKECHRYQKRSDGNIIDVFKEISEQELILEQEFLSPNYIPNNDKVLYSKTFLDKEVFEKLWKDYSVNQKIPENIEPLFFSCEDILVLKPYSTKKINIDLSYLLLRECTYKVQVIDKQNIVNYDILGLKYVKERFEAKHYNKKMISNVIYINK